MLTENKIKLIEDPIEKYKLKLPYYEYIFYDNIIRENELPITGIETYEELMYRVEYLINYLKNTNCKKILVITHSGYLDILLKTIFNTGVLPQANTTNGKNC